MREIEPPFEIDSTGTVSVSEHSVGDARVFHLEFPDNRKPLNIMVSETRKGDKFWTSIPEGRQEEAEQYGKLIANYIRAKRKGQ